MTKRWMSPARVYSHHHLPTLSRTVCEEGHAILLKLAPFSRSHWRREHTASQHLLYPMTCAHLLALSQATYLTEQKLRSGRCLLTHVSGTISAHQGEAGTGSALRPLRSEGLAHRLASDPDFLQRREKFHQAIVMFASQTAQMLGISCTSTTPAKPSPHTAARLGHGVGHAARQLQPGPTAASRQRLYIHTYDDGEAASDAANLVAAHVIQLGQGHNARDTRKGAPGQKKGGGH